MVTEQHAAGALDGSVDPEELTTLLAQENQALLVTLAQLKAENSALKATQPAAGEPVAWQQRAALKVEREARENGRYDFEPAPPAAAHGDEAVLWELLEELRTATDRQALPGEFIRVMWESGCDWINARAAMRAQGGGGEV